MCKYVYVVVSLQDSKWNHSNFRLMKGSNCVSTVMSETRPPRSTQRMHCQVGADLFGPEHLRSAMERSLRKVLGRTCDHWSLYQSAAFFLKYINKISVLANSTSGNYWILYYYLSTQCLLQQDAAVRISTISTISILSWFAVSIVVQLHVQSVCDPTCYSNVRSGL